MELLFLFEDVFVADIAAACGYADQAHLTREVRRFAGLPPAALLAAARGGELQV